MDNFFANIFRKREAVPVSPTDTGAVSTSGRAEKVGSGSYTERIVHARSPRVALTVSAVYRAVELRAKTIGQMPMQFQYRDSEGGNFVLDAHRPIKGNVSFGTKLNYLLQVEPNPMMSAKSMWQQVTINRLMLGNGFIYIERDEFGDPKYLWLAECGGYNFGTNKYTLSYMSDKGFVKNIMVPREDVLHFPNTYRERNGFWGISTLKFAFDTLSLIKTESKLALETAAKGGRLKMLVQEKDAQPVGTRGRANQAELKKITRQFNLDMYDGDAIFLNNVADAKPISLTSQDMQMMETLGMSLDDVARFYATPRPLLMMDTNSHYTTYTNATMEYLNRTIGPDGSEMETECQRKFLTIYDYDQYRFHLCEQPLLRMDKKTQSEVDMLNLQTGAKTVNEVRAEHDMPVVENGDEPMASANLMTLKALIAKGESATELQPGTYTVKSPANKDDKKG